MRVVLPAVKSLTGKPSIGLALVGCKNRPFYRICVFPSRALGRIHLGSIIEELGVFDPLPNYRNEKLVAANVERLKYWIGVKDAHISTPVLELLGLWGILPVHPKTYIRARHNREEREKKNREAASNEEAAVKSTSGQIAVNTTSEDCATVCKNASVLASESEKTKISTDGNRIVNVEASNPAADENKVKTSKKISQDIAEQESETAEKPSAVAENKFEDSEEKCSENKQKLSEEAGNKKIQKDHDAKETL